MFNAAKLKFDDIFENRLSEEEVREYLLELYERGETSAEIAGAASAMRDHLIPLPIHEDLKAKAIDVVGTGGDKSYSFNISSTVSILLASCGCYVAKHGNRDAAWAQHPESRALPGRRDAAQAQQWAAAAWTPEPPALAITHKTDRFNRTTALVSWMSEWPQRRRGVFPPPCPCSLPARATQRA